MSTSVPKPIIVPLPDGGDGLPDPSLSIGEDGCSVTHFHGHFTYLLLIDPACAGLADAGSLSELDGCDIWVHQSYTGTLDATWLDDSCTLQHTSGRVHQDTWLHMVNGQGTFPRSGPSNPGAYVTLANIDKDVDVTSGNLDHCARCQPDSGSDGGRDASDGRPDTGPHDAGMTARDATLDGRAVSTTSRE